MPHPLGVLRDHRAVHLFGELGEQCPVVQVRLDAFRLAVQRVAEARAAAHVVQVQVVILEQAFRGHRLLVALNPRLVADVVLVLEIAGDSVRPERQRQTLLDALLQPRVVGLEAVAGGGRIASHEAPVAVHVAVPHEEHGPVGRLPGHAQGLEAAAAAVLAVAAGVGLDVSAQVEERFRHFPDLDVAHVPFRVPDRRGVVQAVLDGAGPGAGRGRFEAVDGMHLAVLVDAAPLHPVGGVAVAGVHFLEVTAAEVGLAHAAPEGRPPCNQEVPGVGVAGAPVVGVHPGPLGETELGRVVGAVVDPLGRHQRLGQHDPDAAGERHLVRVIGMPAPAARPLEIELPGPLRPDGYLRRRVHDGVDPGKGGRGDHVGMGVGDVGEGDLAVGARDGHGLDPVQEAAPAVLDALVGELLIGLQPLGLDHLLDQLSDHVAAGDAGPLVEDPVLGRAGRALAFVQPVAQRLVVDTGLSAGDLVAVAETGRLPGGHGARGDRAGVDDVGHAPHPADQLVLPEHRHDGGDVAGVHVADGAVVGGEHVAGVDAGVPFPVVFDHVLDGGAHGADMDDDPGRGQHAVARRVVEGEAEFALLLDDRRGGDFLRRFAGMDQAAAELGEEFLIADGIVFLQVQRVDPVVLAGLPGAQQDVVAMLLEGHAAGEQPLVFRLPRPAGPDIRSQFQRLTRYGCLFYL